MPQYGATNAQLHLCLLPDGHLFVYTHPHISLFCSGTIKSVSPNSVIYVFLAVHFLSALPSEPTDLSSGPAAVKNSHLTGRKQQKEDRKVDIHLKPQALHTHLSSELPHSLADLKMYKDTKILVAKFLEHSSCSLPPDVQQVVNNIKCVIKLDEKHMEEAIFSANVIDQVTQVQKYYAKLGCQQVRGKDVSHVLLFFR